MQERETVVILALKGPSFRMAKVGLFRVIEPKSLCSGEQIFLT